MDRSLETTESSGGGGGKVSSTTENTIARHVVDYIMLHLELPPDHLDESIVSSEQPVSPPMHALHCGNADWIITISTFITRSFLSNAIFATHVSTSLNDGNQITFVKESNTSGGARSCICPPKSISAHLFYSEHRARRRHIYIYIHCIHECKVQAHKKGTGQNIKMDISCRRHESRVLRKSRLGAVRDNWVDLLCIRAGAGIAVLGVARITV